MKNKIISILIIVILIFIYSFNNISYAKDEFFIDDNLYLKDIGRK